MARSRPLHRYVCLKSVVASDELVCTNPNYPDVAVDLGTKCVAANVEPCVEAQWSTQPIDSTLIASEFITCDPSLSASMTFCCGDKVTG